MSLRMSDTCWLSYPFLPDLFQDFGRFISFITVTCYCILPGETF